jgi:hypothetical protein
MNIGRCCSDSIPVMIHYDGKGTSSTTHKEGKPSQVGDNSHVSPRWVPLRGDNMNTGH